MTLDKLREYCLTFPGATEQIQWGADLVFKVGGKMFCVACTEVAPNVMSLKCGDEAFAELCERNGIIPAPYMARAKWVALERWDTLSDQELKPLVAEAYRLIKEKLPLKAQASLGQTKEPKAAKATKATKGPKDFMSHSGGEPMAGNPKKPLKSKKR